MVPEAGGMRSLVLRHRLLVSYVPLQTESSGNVLRRHLCIWHNLSKNGTFRNSREKGERRMGKKVNKKTAGSFSICLHVDGDIGRMRQH